MSGDGTDAVPPRPRGNPPIRVLFVSPFAPPYYSGAGAAVVCTAAQLKRQGVEVGVLALRRDDETSSHEVLEDGVPIFRCTARLGRFWHLWFHLWCALWLIRRPRSWDVIQFAYMPRYWSPLRSVARLLRMRVFLRMTMLGSDDLASIRSARLGRLRVERYQHVDGIWAMGQGFADRSAGHLRHPDRLFVVPKLIDDAVFRPADRAEKERLRAKIGARPEQLVVVFTGAISLRKGMDLLIDAWADVAKALPEARLHLVGPRTFWAGAEEANISFIRALDERIEALGLREQVTFAGQVPNVSEYLRAADLFVFPSRREATHPSALLEAMACGLPAVVCEQPWLPADLVVHDETGWRCDPCPPDLAATLIASLRDPRSASRIGQAAAEAVRRKHDPRSVTEQLLGIYRAAVAGAR